jgi:hypothetical protein
MEGEISFQEFPIFFAYLGDTGLSWIEPPCRDARGLLFRLQYWLVSSVVVWHGHRAA